MAIAHRAAKRDRTAIESDYKLQLVQHLEYVVDPLGRIQVKTLLGWRGWGWYDDAIIAQAPSISGDGTYDVDGVYLNPLGRAHRPLDFEDQSALAMIRFAMDRGELVESAGGYAAPIGRHPSAMWGGAWFKKLPVGLAEPPTRTLFPIFLGILLLTTLLVLMLLRRTVLEPVEALASAARRLSSGDLSARVASSTSRSDESPSR